MTDFGEHILLAGVGLDMLAVWAETKSESDIAHALPLVRLCRSASRVRSPIASRSHCETAAMMVVTSRPAAEAVSSDSATEISATPRFSKSSSKLQRS